MPAHRAEWGYFSASTGGLAGVSFLAWWTAQKIPARPMRRKTATLMAMMMFTLVVRLWTFTSGWPAVCGSKPMRKEGLGV